MITNINNKCIRYNKYKINNKNEVKININIFIIKPLILKYAYFIKHCTYTLSF